MLVLHLRKVQKVTIVPYHAEERLLAVRGLTARNVLRGSARTTTSTGRPLLRHGTTRTQSVLSIVRLMLHHPRHTHRAFHALSRLLARLARGWTIIPESVLCLPLATGPPGK